MPFESDLPVEPMRQGWFRAVGLPEQDSVASFHIGDTKEIYGPFHSNHNPPQS